MFNIFKKKTETLTINFNYGDEKLSLLVEVVKKKGSVKMTRIVGQVPRDFDVEGFVEAADEAVRNYYDNKAVLIA